MGTKRVYRVHQIDERVEIRSYNELTEEDRHDVDNPEDEEYWDDPRYFVYGGTLYSVNDAMEIGEGWLQLPGAMDWDGYIQWWLGAGIVITMLGGDDEGFVRVGRYYHAE